MIQTVPLTLGKHIGNQAVAHVMAKCPQYPARLFVTAGHQRESFQADHGIATPVREPGVPGNNGPDFIAGGAHAYDVLHSANGRNEKLISGEHQFCRRAPLCLRRSGSQKPLAAIQLCPIRHIR